MKAYDMTDMMTIDISHNMQMSKMSIYKERANMRLKGRNKAGILR